MLWVSFCFATIIVFTCIWLPLWWSVCWERYNIAIDCVICSQAPTSTPSLYLVSLWRHFINANLIQPAFSEHWSQTSFLYLFIYFLYLTYIVPVFHFIFVRYISGAMQEGSLNFKFIFLMLNNLKCAFPFPLQCIPQRSLYLEVLQGTHCEKYRNFT